MGMSVGGARAQDESAGFTGGSSSTGFKLSRIYKLFFKLTITGKRFKLCVKLNLCI